MNSIGNVLDKYKKLNYFENQSSKKYTGATYSWQDRAVQVWHKLVGKGKPTSQWFRVFKLYPGLCERAYSNMADAGKKATPEKYFYWLIGYYRKGSKK